MNIVLEKGRYVVAVSGGVDSVVLLTMLTKQNDLDLIVAHFDHGIREDSANDRKFVERLAQEYGLTFEYSEGHLGSNASEETARKARYDFLSGTKDRYEADAIVTAHHQDDVLETMCINILRGTKRKGLSSLQNTDDIKRPLLNYSKQQIITYAQDHRLVWHEDSTNNSDMYLRNWVRKNIIPKLSDSQREKLLSLQEETKDINDLTDSLLDQLAPGSVLEKRILLLVDHQTGLELVAHWLRNNNLREFDSKTLERILVAAKTKEPGKKVPVYGQKQVMIEKHKLTISS